MIYILTVAMVILIGSVLYLISKQKKLDARFTKNLNSQEEWASCAYRALNEVERLDIEIPKLLNILK